MSALPQTSLWCGRFDLLGKRWTGVLLGTLRASPVGFRALARAVPGISDSVLSDRLGELTEAGLVARTVAEGPPVSVTYTLTEAGRALLPALEQIRRWAERHLNDSQCRGTRLPQNLRCDRRVADELGSDRAPRRRRPNSAVRVPDCPALLLAGTSRR